MTAPSPRKARVAAVVLAAVLAGCASPSPSPDTPGAIRVGDRVVVPFTTDGCSHFPDRSSQPGGADWCGCCVAHDLSYWRGGTWSDRWRADTALRHCVASAADSELLAWTMFLGVRAGGGPWWPTSYRWGYGWTYEGLYHELTPAEKAAADTLEQQARTQPGPGGARPLACPSAPASASRSSR